MDRTRRTVRARSQTARIRFVRHSIEPCGLKGTTRGDAIVSPLHGNFIVNRGHATAADVLTLIEDVHDRVLEKTGVDLQREVKVWRGS